MADVIQLFPEAAAMPIQGPRKVPVDLDAVGDRYTALLEARHRGDDEEIALLEAACADDIPAMRDEVARVESLRAELAAALEGWTS